MRNPLKRLARGDAPKMPLRERLTLAKDRLAGAKGRAGRALAAGRILLKAPAAPVPAVDRAALVNYATWLYMERRLVCMELYPHLGARADRFVLSLVPADSFHFPPGRGWRDVPKPSTRAVKILDMIGLDWRSDRDPDLGDSSLQDNGERPALPRGWPALDAELVSALADLRGLDAAIEALLPDAYDDPDDLPGYTGLETARNDVLDTLQRRHSESLSGLKAKAQALLTSGVRDDQPRLATLSRSLANDILDARNHTIKPRPDPILPALAECERLEAACMEGDANGGFPGGNPTPEQQALGAAVWQHWRTVVLQTVPTTGVGCAALARFASAFYVRWGSGIDDDAPALLSAIARSPLL